jgi:hypothetical protein
MKSFVFLILCLFSVIGLKAQTNVYHKWPRNNAVWYDLKQTVDPQTWLTTNTYTTMLMAGDSTINDSIFIIVCWDYNQDTCYELFYEDTLNLKIILRRYPENIIFYEFEKQIGDSVIA